MSVLTNLTTLEKILGMIVAVVVSIVALGTYTYKGYDHFATKAYAEEKHTTIRSDLSEADQAVLEELHTTQQKLTISGNRSEIWRAKREIKRLERDRIKSTNTLTDIMLIDSDIAEYKDLIECIRDAKELCY